MSYSEFRKYRKQIKFLTTSQLKDAKNIRTALKSSFEGRFEVVYTPFEYINPKAKIAIVGITPGPDQLVNAVAEASRCLDLGLSDEQTLQSAKKIGAFSSKLRPNLIAMLNAIHLNEWLGIKDCSELFESRSELVQTCSLIKNATFVWNNKGESKPYAGSKTDILKPDVQKLIHESFVPMLKELPKETLYIPLGPTVDAALTRLIDEGFLVANRVLTGLPHPSAQNAGRVNIFLGKRTEPFRTCGLDDLKNIQASRQRLEQIFLVSK